MDGPTSDVLRLALFFSFLTGQSYGSLLRLTTTQGFT